MVITGNMAVMLNTDYRALVLLPKVYFGQMILMTITLVRGFTLRPRGTLEYWYPWEATMETSLSHRDL
jgi:hypothetical protein